MKPTFLAAIAMTIIDQATKWLALSLLARESLPRMDVIPGWFSLGMVWNPGINFGFLGAAPDLVRALLIALAVAVFVASMRWASQMPGLKAKVALGCFAGGGIGNAIDRLIHGAVFDFLNVSGFGFENPYFFNIADVAIFAGAGALVLFASRQHEPVAA